MDGIHDMGGMEGFGPVPFLPDDQGRVDERWEAVAGAAIFALMRSGRTNIDAHRHRIERLDPSRYLPIGYWGRWLAAVESATVDQGVADQAEIDELLRQLGHDPASTAPPPRMQPVERLESRRNEPGFIRAVDRDRRFSVGDRVTTLDTAPHRGHHRLPRYARGRTGTVARVYPAFTLPDAVAHDRGEQPEYLYAVGFDGRDLWGPDGDPRQICHLDLFETYLRPAEEQPTNEQQADKTAGAER